METDSKAAQMTAKAREWITEQEWFQQLKAKWEELDPQSRTYAKWGALGSSAFLLLALIVFSIGRVHSLRSELRGKQELLDQLQASSDELNRLRSESSGMTEGERPDWPAYFTERATIAGLDPESIGVSAEKAAPPAGETREALFDIKLKHVLIKQVVRYSLGLETGGKPVKLRALAIDTKSDPTGYMDATLSVSAFSLMPGKS